MIFSHSQFACAPAGDPEDHRPAQTPAPAPPRPAAAPALPPSTAPGAPTRSTAFTSDCVLISTPRWFTSLIRQAMIVCDESVTGNIRPASSVFSSTPRSANQLLVSVVNQ